MTCLIEAHKFGLNTTMMACCMCNKILDAINEFALSLKNQKTVPFLFKNKNQLKNFLSLLNKNCSAINNFDIVRSFF